MVLAHCTPVRRANLHRCNCSEIVHAVYSTYARSPAPTAAVFIYNDLSVRRVGLHFHASSDISHLITPLVAKAAGSWAVVQQMHSQLQNGNTVNLKVFLLQSSLLLHYGCKLCGLHSLCGAANKACTWYTAIHDHDNPVTQHGLASYETKFECQSFRLRSKIGVAFAQQES